MRFIITFRFYISHFLVGAKETERVSEREVFDTCKYDMCVYVCVQGGDTDNNNDNDNNDNYYNNHRRRSNNNNK